MIKNKFLELFRNQFIIVAILIAVFTVLGFAGQHYFLFDIMSQFSSQYYIIGVILFIGLLIWNKFIKTPKWALILCILIIVVNAAQLIPWKRQMQPEMFVSDMLMKISLMNVLTSNDSYNAVLDNINTQKPDVIFLEEVNDEWLKNMSELDKIYPYSIKHPREDNFGVALYSKVSFKTSEIKYFGHFEIPLIVCTIEKYNKKLKIIGIHTTPPANQDYFINRNEMLSELADYVKNEKLPTIVIGDLNTTMYSPSYKQFIKKSQLINPRKNFGIIPTWSPKSRDINGLTLEKLLKFAAIPIDQVLHNSKVYIAYLKADKSIGSDHLPLQIEFFTSH